MKNIVLIGFMGTGKSSVGKALARALNRRAVDVDQEIEALESAKISDIFETKGEAYFRECERRVIERLARESGLIITTGGGAVMDPVNLERLKSRGIIIALFASAETIYSRVKESKHRPLLKVPDVMAEIQRLLTVRKPYYEKSDYQFVTDGLKPADVAQLILKEVRFDE